MAPPSKDKPAAEDELWRSVKAGTRPLGSKKRIAKSGPSKKTPPAPPPKKPPPPAAVAPKKEPAPKETAQKAGHDRRSSLRLKRGQLAIEATLDLHGMTQAEAHRTLNAALPRAQREGKRTVLIVTGKGSAKEGGGVLRKNVPRWLQESPLAAIVLDHSKAKDRHGGAGALYVRLRKARPKP
ncbi:MAG: Smr/MutS family protein [Alphaproteobacteria bacterium]|nr:Smr/MutS family protein [Alphaproteobacteria bacterium]